MILYLFGELIRITDRLTDDIKCSQQVKVIRQVFVLFESISKILKQIIQSCKLSLLHLVFFCLFCLFCLLFFAFLCCFSILFVSAYRLFPLTVFVWAFAWDFVFLFFFAFLFCLWSLLCVLSGVVGYNVLFLNFFCGFFFFLNRFYVMPRAGRLCHYWRKKILKSIF